MATNITIYTTRYCPFCVRAKQLLSSKKVTFKEIAVDNDSKSRQEMTRLSGRNTVPQIWINEKHIGGCDELYALERANKLDGLLQN